MIWPTIRNWVLPGVICFLLLCVVSRPVPAQGSSIKDVATAYIAELNVLFFFGGWDERTPIVASAGYINLTASFSVDSPPITSIPSIPVGTSRLVPYIVKNAIGDSFDILVSGGVTPTIPTQSGVFVPGTTAWTYSILKDLGSSGGPASLRVTVNGGRSTEGLPFGPAVQYGATTANGVFGNAYAFGGRTFPAPYFNQLKVVDKFGAYSTVAFNNNSAPMPRADSQLVRVNTTHLIVAGGEGNATKLNDIWLFNIPQSTWIRYPHSFNQPHAYGGFVVYTAPSSTQYAILIGRNSPFIEYFNLSANGPPQAADALGQGPASLEQPSAIMIGDQMVIVGGFTKTGDPDQRFLRVLKVKESTENKLSFEWQNTFTPKPVQVNPSPTSSPATGGGSAGGNVDGMPSWLLYLIISGAVLGGILAIGVAIFVFRRHKRRQPSSKAHQTKSADLGPGASIKQPLCASSTPAPAVRVTTSISAPPTFPGPVANVSTYPLSPPHPVSTAHDAVILSKSTTPGVHHPQHPAAHESSPAGAASGHAADGHHSATVVVDVSTEEEDDVVYLPQPPLQHSALKPSAPLGGPFETLLLPTRPTHVAEDAAVLGEASPAGLDPNRSSDVQQLSAIGTLYLPTSTEKRTSRGGKIE